MKERKDKEQTDMQQQYRVLIVEDDEQIRDGIEMVMELRKSYNFPVIMLSAKSEEVD